MDESLQAKIVLLEGLCRDLAHVLDDVATVLQELRGPRPAPLPPYLQDGPPTTTPAPVRWLDEHATAVDLQGK